MKVKLISHTQDALELLLLSKNTRLKGEEQTIESIRAWPMEKKLEHLGYMRDTIKSSWEFIDYTFQIQDVTRAFTHQFVRTRTGTYAQEAQRVVDLSDSTWLTPPSLDPTGELAFDITMQNSISGYSVLRGMGVPAQDARGVIPTNIHTNIMGKFNLRTLSDMALVRMCVRTQGEYQDVFRAMRQCVIDVHPWAEDFINVHCVATGICCFPRYDKCPVKPYTYNAGELNDKMVKLSIKDKFFSIKHESVPEVFKGKATTSDGDKGEE